MSKRPVIDGFVPRRSPTSVGSDVNRKLPPADLTNFQRTIATESGAGKVKAAAKKTAGKRSAPAVSTLQPAQSHGLSRTDIDDSLREIDEQPTEQKRGRGRKKTGSKHPRRRKIIKRVVIAILLLLLAGGIYIGVKAVLASNSVFNGDIFGLVQHKKLKQDEGGRTNILIFGTSEDDPGHDAAWLTDSIMVLSVNQETKDAYMVSIPRDLEVKYGQACTPGYSGKINVVYGCNYEDGKNEEAGAKELMEQVSDVTGLDIPYYAHVNYSVVRDIVKALGTITVNIEGGDGAPGIMDSNFDWKCKGGIEYASRATMIKNCPPNGHFIEYPNGPAELDAEHALYLAQARGDGDATYGLGRSNPDREQNQQKIIIAMKDKALSTGTLTNVAKVTGLIDAIGNNLRTNFETTEIRTLMDLAKDIPNESINRMDLVKEGALTGSGQPSLGQFNFSGLHTFLKKKLYATGISKEDPTVMVLNGTGVGGVAQEQADILTELGMTAIPGNAPEGSFQSNVIYRVGKAPKTHTAAKLKELYGAEPKYAESIPGVTIGEDTDYVVILITQPKPKTTTE